MGTIWSVRSLQVNPLNMVCVDSSAVVRITASLPQAEISGSATVTGNVFGGGNAGQVNGGTHVTVE